MGSAVPLTAGNCLEQPAEPADSTFKKFGRQAVVAPSRSRPPLLPRFDLFVRDDLEREVGITRLPCNWLQIMENSLDPVHLEYLHSGKTRGGHERLA